MDFISNLIDAFISVFWIIFAIGLIVLGVSFFNAEAIFTWLLNASGDLFFWLLDCLGDGIVWGAQALYDFILASF